MKNEIEFTQVNSDINGNPRYVCHFHALINEQDRERAKKLYNDKNKGLTGYEIELLYSIAVKRAKKLGGRKFHNKQFGGGIVFQSYNIQKTGDKIKEFINNLTYVQFYVEKDGADVFAYFPHIDEGGENKLSYAHVGQHSACSPDYVKECKKATRRKYLDLKKELENIGYELEII